MHTYKLLSAAQIKEWDQKTMEIQQISSDELMERVGIKLFYALLKNEKKYLKKHPVHIFSGVGNNGGDGLVMARLLYLSGYKVKLTIVPFSKNFSNDFKLNLNKIEDLDIELDFFNKDTAIDSQALVIDAIFGIGLNRPVEGIAKKAIKLINRSKKYKTISIDIPSGMFVDFPNHKKDPIVIADDVYSIELPKRSFFFPENIKYIKDYKLISIGLEKKVLKKLKTRFYSYYIDPKEDLKRKENAYKYKFGHAMIIGGSYGMLGAPLLASKAALRSGAGLVTTILPRCGFIPAQSSIHETMVIPVKNKKYIDMIPEFPASVNAIGIGPGLGTKEKTKKAILEFIANYSHPLLIDADGLNILSQNKKYLKLLPKASILTPHEGEFKRLTGEGKFKNSFEKILYARKLAKKHKLIFVLKGPYTAITDGKKIFFNPFANSALAKAGTGDVLTGIISGVFAQKQKSLVSALIGVQLHAKAAEDFNNKKYNKFSLLASDLIKNLKKIH